MIITGFDTETYLISASEVIPRLVCGTTDDGACPGLEAHCEPGIMEMFDTLFYTALAGNKIIIQNAAFDLTVVLRWTFDVEAGKQPGDPRRAREIRAMLWEVMETNIDREVAGQGMILHDTAIREKLQILSTTGQLDTAKGISLATLTQKYLGIDISGSKAGPDVWRLRYSELDGVPSSEYPPEAGQYALSDATYARLVFIEQDKNITRSGPYSANSESLQIYADTALRISSSHGFLIDRSQVKKVKDRMEAEVSPEKMQPLIDAGVLRTNGSIDTKALKERVIKAWEKIGMQPRRTDGGDICCDGEVIMELKDLDPIIELYGHRQDYQKTLTAFIPNLDQPVVFTNYDILKETGRTSSYGGNEKKKSPYPAINIQQLPRAPGVRECFIARPGWVLCSTDYTALELCSVGQVTYTLFGQSVHRERINAGYDMHSFFGSAMSAAIEPTLVANNPPGADETYRAFLKSYKGKDEIIKKRARHFRSSAKPVGLGYPGMMGPATMAAQAKSNYNLDFTEEEAKFFRDLWREIYPEAMEMKHWTEAQQMPSGDYEYETQGLCRYRAGATYNACANGKFMQSLSADGAKLAGCWLARAMYGGLPESHPWRILEGCRILAFIHDEYITELPDDEWVTERALLVAHIQCLAMAVVMPDIRFTINADDFPDPDAKPSVEPALMYRWDKNAEPVWVPAKEPGYAGTFMQENLPEIVRATKNRSRVLVPWEKKG